MNSHLAIPPTELRDYAKSLGWRLLEEAVRDRLFVMENPNFPRRQLIFPIDDTVADRDEIVLRMAGKLAGMHGFSLPAILDQIAAVGDDTIRLRITSDRHDGSLPLTYAEGILSGTEQMLLASACSVLKPQRHHPRLGRADAQQLINASRFRHTEEGSFVVKISCPVNALDIQPQTRLILDEEDTPFVRRTTQTLESNLLRLVTAIEADSVDKMVADIKSAAAPLLSSNFCDALAKFYDDGLKNALEVDIQWAPSHPHAATKAIRIQRDYFHMIEEVGRELRPAETFKDGVYVGTVDRLDGDIDDDGRRCGEALLILLMDGETVRAKVHLTADDYAKAIQAHAAGESPVKVRGRLHPGRQPRLLTDIVDFQPV